MKEISTIVLSNKNSSLAIEHSRLKLGRKERREREGEASSSSNVGKLRSLQQKKTIRKGNSHTKPFMTTEL